jgi:hypothetical protein
MRPHVSGTERKGFAKARHSWNLVLAALQAYFLLSEPCGRRAVVIAVARAVVGVVVVAVVVAIAAVVVVAVTVWQLRWQWWWRGWW